MNAHAHTWAHAQAHTHTHTHTNTYAYNGENIYLTKLTLYKIRFKFNFIKL